MNCQFTGTRIRRTPAPYIFRNCALSVSVHIASTGPLRLTRESWVSVRGSVAAQTYFPIAPRIQTASPIRVTPRNRCEVTLRSLLMLRLSRRDQYTHLLSHSGRGLGRNNNGRHLRVRAVAAGSGSLSKFQIYQSTYLPQALRIGTSSLVPRLTATIELGVATAVAGVNALSTVLTRTRTAAPRAIAIVPTGRRGPGRSSDAGSSNRRPAILTSKGLGET